MLLLTSAAMAQPPSYGIDFVTIGAAGNPDYVDPGWPNSGWPVHGRGSVGYEYRIAKLEVTTGQWFEFLNTFSSASVPHPFWQILGPQHWGAAEDPLFPGPGVRYKLRNLPNATQLPVAGISWRMSALYCNWLSNGKSASLASLVTGSYDTSTWGNATQPSGAVYFTDDWTHLPNAPFWIPTLDEHVKASHYDPNRYGPGQGGWWASKNSSDIAGTPGPPGVGTTSAGYQPGGGVNVWDIPLGAYPNSLSPWGLLDTSGGAQELIEEVFNPSNPEDRGYSSSYAGASGHAIWDSIDGIGSIYPGGTQPSVGLRIASAAPSPTTLAPLAIAGLLFMPTRRRSRI
ncbi:MAG: SUMF1/EgtB/PvdO family nonheme iron enzyme [Phycisphaerales bacterium]